MGKYLFKTHRTIKPTFWEIIKRFSTSSTSQSSADKASLPHPHFFIDFWEESWELGGSSEGLEKKVKKKQFSHMKKRYKKFIKQFYYLPWTEFSTGRFASSAEYVQLRESWKNSENALKYTRVKFSPLYVCFSSFSYSNWRKKNAKEKKRRKFLSRLFDQL